MRTTVVAAAAAGLLAIGGTIGVPPSAYAAPTPTPTRTATARTTPAPRPTAPAATPGATPLAAQNAPAEKRATPTNRSDEFNDNTIAADWRVFDKTDPGPFKSIQRPENVTERTLPDGTGVLDIRISRHCLKTTTELVSNANKFEGVCPEGTITRYSSGRMQSGLRFGAPKAVEVRAYMDSVKIGENEYDRHHGLSTAAWMHNDQLFCSDKIPKSDLAELDLMEVWDEDYHKHMTYMGCNGADWNKYAVQVDKDMPGKWITYRVEWDGYSLRYLEDGVPVVGPQGDRVTAQSLGITHEKFAELINNHLWQVVFHVNLPKPGWSNWVDDSKPFPDHHDLFDYVRYEAFDPTPCAPTGAIAQVAARTPELGAPITCETPAGVPGARVQVFQNGRVYTSPTTGTHAVTGAVEDKFLASGGEAELGVPTGDPIAIRDGGTSQRFTRATIFYSPTTGAHWARGRILDKYAALGWENGTLGYPVTDEICGIRDGGCFQRFQRENGHIYWSAATDAHMMHGEVFRKYGQVGWETSDLGYPITDEICGIRGGGCFQRFQRSDGHIYWQPQAGAHIMKGRIFARYGAMGWENSALRYPATDEDCGLRDGGCFQRFQGENGHIYWSRATDAWAVQGMIFAHYAQNRWEQGRFGYPTGPETCRDVPGARECTQTFQGGRITWNSATGARG